MLNGATALLELPLKQEVTFAICSRSLQLVFIKECLNMQVGVTETETLLVQYPDEDRGP